MVAKSVPKYALEQLSEQLAQKQKEIDALKQEFEWVEKATFYFPEIVQRQDRWKKVSYYSRFVNEVAEDFEYRRTCGCCANAPMEVFPYLTFENKKIYASSGGIIIRRSRDYGREKFVHDWKERLQKSNISRHVINKIGQMIDPDEVEAPESNED